jgi:hypothetical protein
MYYKFSLRCSSHRISLFSLLQSLPLRFAVPGFVVHGWKVLGQHRAGRQAAAPAERGDDGTELLGKALDRWGKDAEYIYIYICIYIRTMVQPETAWNLLFSHVLLVSIKIWICRICIHIPIKLTLAKFTVESL